MVKKDVQILLSYPKLLIVLPGKVREYLSSFPKDLECLKSKEHWILISIYYAFQTYLLDTYLHTYQGPWNVKNLDGDKSMC